MVTLIIIISLLWILALFCFLIGLMFLFQDHRRPANRFASMTSISLGAWLILNSLDPLIFDFKLSLVLGHLTFFSTVPMVMGWIGLSSLSSYENRQSPPWVFPTNTAIFLVGCLITLTPRFLIEHLRLHVLPLEFNDYVTDVGEKLFLLYYIGLMLWGFILAERNMHRARGIEKIQHQFVFFSGLFSNIGGTLLSGVLPSTAGINVPWAGPTFTIFWVVGIGYAMTKHRLLEAEVVTSQVFLGLLFTFSLLTIVGSVVQGDIVYGVSVSVAMAIAGIFLLRQNKPDARARDVQQHLAIKRKNRNPA